MELLWTSLEEWLILLRTEIKHKHDDSTNSSPKLPHSPKKTSRTKRSTNNSRRDPTDTAVLVGASGGQPANNTFHTSHMTLEKKDEKSGSSSSNETSPPQKEVTVPQSLFDPLARLTLESRSVRPSSLPTESGSSSPREACSASPASPGESVRRVASERLSWGCGNSEENEDIISAIAPRICAVIQAFYMCCACTTQEK